jgi:hypothetical protein
MEKEPIAALLGGLEDEVDWKLTHRRVLLASCFWSHRLAALG